MHYIEMNKLIAEFQRTGSLELRNRIVVEFLPLVQQKASVVASRLHKQVSEDDLIISGVFGLIDALSKFDPDRGYTFPTFAMLRIRGQMFDDIRDYDEISRLSRTRVKMVREATELFKTEHGRLPTHDELFAAMDLPLDLFNKVAARHPSNAVSINSTLFDDERKLVTFAERIPEREPPDPDAKMDAETIINITLKEFGLRDALFLKLRFLEGRTLQDCMAAFNVTEPAMSWRLKHLLRRLRRRFNPQSFKAFAGGVG